ncbi:MAG TPA: glycosyltransferase family 2 protein [Burkholderiales bacterium]|jgi:(heptosyl)LPS beta-1,4-glucosyltransferase
MARLSVVIIARNESRALRACLDSVAWADEIVVLDGGSDDNTAAIARTHTDKVYVEREWRGYGVQRQRAQARASGDWILMIDADERVTPALRAEVERVVATDDRTRAYEIPILPWCFGRFIRHGGWYPAHKVRLYPAAKARYGAQRVHEKLEFDQGVRIERLKGDLLHFTYRDLEHYLVKSARYAAEWAHEREAAGRRTSLAAGIGHGIACFLRMYVLRGGFLDGRAGFLLALLSTHSTFVKYADLWVRRQPPPA